jgi:hypothetical protein
VLKGDEETIKTAYNYLKTNEKVELLKKEYDDTVEKNREITRKINSLTERINNTIPTKIGDILDISNDENISDYKARLLEITRNEKGAVLKIITAKKKEYTLVVTKEGKTKTGYVTNFVFESSKEDAGTLRAEKENLKSQLVSVKDNFDYDNAFSKLWKDYFTTIQPSTQPTVSTEVKPTEVTERIIKKYPVEIKIEGYSLNSQDLQKIASFTSVTEEKGLTYDEIESYPDGIQRLNEYEYIDKNTADQLKDVSKTLETLVNAFEADDRDEVTDIKVFEYAKKLLDENVQLIDRNQLNLFTDEELNKLPPCG